MLSLDRNNDIQDFIDDLDLIAAKKIKLDQTLAAKLLVILMGVEREKHGYYES